MALRGMTTLLALRRIQSVPLALYHENVSDELSLRVSTIFTLHNIYQVLEHYENPRNVGSFDKKDKNVGTGLVGAPACGDVMKLQIRVDDNGKIIDAKFKTFGCGSAIGKSNFY